MSQPLILTLQLDPSAQAFYEELRRQYFPPERNRIPAHLTLFHQLPDDDHTHQAIAAAAHTTALFPLTKPTLRSIGRGVAVFLQAEPLTLLHSSLSATFQPDLTPQDRQRLRPHIVIQNKVDPETAQRTLRELVGLPFPEPQAIGLTLWRYLGGPWERLLEFSFAIHD